MVNGTEFILLVLAGAVFFYLLYGVIRAAVRDGILQAEERRVRRAGQLDERDSRT